MRGLLCSLIEYSRVKRVKFILSEFSHMKAVFKSVFYGNLLAEKEGRECSKNLKSFFSMLHTYIHCEIVILGDAILGRSKKEN